MQLSERICCRTAGCHGARLLLAGADGEEPLGDRLFAEVKDLGDVPHNYLGDVEHSFGAYMQSARVRIETLGWGPAAEGTKEVGASVERYRAAAPS
jgi:hypothetical protein